MKSALERQVIAKREETKVFRDYESFNFKFRDRKPDGPDVLGTSKVHDAD